MGQLPLVIAAIAASSLCIHSCQALVLANENSAQLAWSQSRLGQNDHVSDLLEGSLEYSWSSSGAKPLRHAPQWGEQQQMSTNKVRLQDLESAFDYATTTRQFEAAGDLSPDPGPPVGPIEKPRDCTVHLDAVMDASFVLQDELTKEFGSYSKLTPAMEPLSRIIVIPEQREDRLAMVKAMRRLNMGLVGFDHIAQYLPQETDQQVLRSIISKTEILRRRAEDVITCEDGSLFFDFSDSPSKPSCAGVQLFYDDYLAQVKTQVESMQKMEDMDKQALQVALNTLQFQIAGAYLTHQGALEAVDQLEKSSASKDTRALVTMMRLATGAGDALQACQTSMQRGVIRQESRSDSVSDFEQLIYAHIAMNARRQDPVARSESSLNSSRPSDTAYGHCQSQYDEVMSTAKSIVNDLGVTKNQLASGGQMVHTILSQYVQQVEDRLQRPLEEKTEMELRQLEMAMALLVRTVKALPSSASYSAMKEAIELIEQLELELHRLYSCVITNTPGHFPTESEYNSLSNEDEGEEDTAWVMDPLRCDILVETYRDSLAQSLQRLGPVTKTKDSEGKATAFLQSSLQALVGAVDQWEEDEDAVADNGPQNEWRQLLQKISSQSTATRSRTVREFIKMVPLMVAQANALQACSNVWRVTRGGKVSAYKDHDNDLEDEDLDFGAMDESDEEDEEDG
ncbi:hypothetical protein EDD11_006768 [Mortierella claussenii]|nr:hypothetical protein EDD11_006768 [Mortierella claussenii]